MEALLSILDSPVTKAGRLQAVYVRIEKGVLFEVKPHVRIPRTYKRFSGIMLQLLQKLNVTAVGKREKLLRVIKNPVTNYFPVNSHKIGFSHSSDKLVKMNKYVDAVGDDTNLIFVMGAMAHGKIATDYIDDFSCRFMVSHGIVNTHGKHVMIFVNISRVRVRSNEFDITYIEMWMKKVTPKEFCPLFRSLIRFLIYDSTKLEWNCKTIICLVKNPHYLFVFLWTLGTSSEWIHTSIRTTSELNRRRILAPILFSEPQQLRYR